MMKKVVFRADDLGYSEGVNYGIDKAIRQGLIGSLGVMVNMPASQHGVDLVKGYDIALSVHVTISSGRPLTDPSCIPSLVQEDGTFQPSYAYRSSTKDRVVFEEALLEVEAQYQQFVAFFGRKPDYMEGHAVASATFFRAIETIADKYGVTYSGLPQDFSQPICIGNSQVRMNVECMLPDYDPSAMVQRVVSQMTEEVVELFVCHPGYLDQELLDTSSLTLARPLEVAMLTDPRTKSWLEEQGVALLDYRDL